MPPLAALVRFGNLLGYEMQVWVYDGRLSVENRASHESPQPFGSESASCSPFAYTSEYLHANNP